MSVQQYVSRIDELLARPLNSDDDYHLVILHESRDFAPPNDDWDELMRTSEEFEEELGELAAALDARWGPHESMSMEDYSCMDPDDDELPPFFGELVESGYFGDLLYWRVGDRIVAASVGHEDKEQPVVLFTGVTGSAEGFPG
ncbi:hypothetical protein H1V43_07120 [Streptomyces sp. PSKA54]|uniref:Uncharacterized protein n=1 Tax=Streptomyces himalayensis subsp. aureolus TaxID=2758039 RepID=A0A7W2CY02_9ACTN|nr:hypothetical protein [Streptomyces himalayensis]MBA4861156.1 hypothetical protein [Streptomyces himalayensis subsp. aureolus]